MKLKRKDGQCFATISPYDFYLTNYPRSTIVRLFMVNENFKVMYSPIVNIYSSSYPSFNQKFNSISVLKGNSK